MGSDVNAEQFASIKNRAEQSPSRKAAAIILKKLNAASRANEYVETNAPLTNTDAIRDTISTLPVDDANLNPLERRSIQALRDAIRSSGKIGGYEFGPEQLPLLDRRIKLGRPDGTGSTFAGLQSGIRELFGKNAYIVTGLPEGAPSGFVFPSISNTLFLNANGKYPAAFLLGHEFGHLLKRGNAEIYKDLSDYILASAKARPVYNAMLAGNNYRSDQLNDEFVNDFIGTQLNDPTFWKGLAGKDGSLFDKVIRAAISFLNGLKTRVSKLSRDVLPYFDNIPEVRAKLAEALREYRRVGDINDVWSKSSDAELVAGPRRRNSDVNQGQMDMFTAFQPDLQEYTSALEKEGITSQEAKITAATQDLGITAEVATDIIQRATPVTQDAATDLLGQVQPATDITGQAGTTFKPRNIIEGFMSPDFVYKIATSTQVPIGRKLIASKLYERKIKGFHPLWRISVIERDDGDRYWMAENAIDQSANSLSAITSFEESSASQLESRALEPIATFAANLWRENRPPVKSPSTQAEQADPNQMGLLSEDSVDYKAALAYAKKVGASNIEEAANGISRTLQFTAPGRVGEDGIYSQTELFGGPETGGTGTAAIEAGQKAAAALRKNKAPTGPSADLIAGLQGNWEELAREIDAKGRASFIFADLSPPRAISRKAFETRRLGKSEAAP